jgi:phosphoglycolate phosphatase-like HAD superfamily hydrolase
MAPQEAVYIGDSSWDIQAAKSAGCRAIAVTSGMALRRDLEREKPDMIFSSLAEAAKELCK